MVRAKMTTNWTSCYGGCFILVEKRVEFISDASKVTYTPRLGWVLRFCYVSKPAEVHQVDF